MLRSTFFPTVEVLEDRSLPSPLVPSVSPVQCIEENLHRDFAAVCACLQQEESCPVAAEESEQAEDLALAAAAFFADEERHSDDRYASLWESESAEDHRRATTSVFAEEFAGRTLASPAPSVVRETPRVYGRLPRNLPEEIPVAPVVIEEIAVPPRAMPKHQRQEQSWESWIEVLQSTVAKEAQLPASPPVLPMEQVQPPVESRENHEPEAPEAGEPTIQPEKNDSSAPSKSERILPAAMVAGAAAAAVTFTTALPAAPSASAKPSWMQRAKSGMKGAWGGLKKLWR